MDENWYDKTNSIHKASYMNIVKAYTQIISEFTQAFSHGAHKIVGSVVAQHIYTS